MAIKTEFDSKSFSMVLVRSLTGALIGAVPGSVYIMATGRNLTSDAFGVGLVQAGMMTGAIACGLAALAATINATLKSRGSGPSGKAKRLNEYLNPDTLPAIPPSTKPAKEAIKEDATEVTMSAVPVVAPLVIHAAPAKPAAVAQPEQPVFEDFDHN